MLICNFCGKNQKEVRKLLQGADNVHICDRCVSLSNNLLEKELNAQGKKLSKQELKSQYKTLYPKQIHHELNLHVIGKEQAKKGISVAIYNHCKRVLNETKVPVQKSNLLFVGPTGVGKTLIAQTIANLLDVPFIISDATTLTESGYAGDDTEVLIQRLAQKADYNISKTEIGIIYVDEIDKKAKRNDYVNLSRDVSGEGVQQSLLKLMEGTVVNIPDPAAGPNAKNATIEVDTTNILFILSGAFVGLKEIVEQRVGTRRIGFSEAKIQENDIEWANLLEPQDLIKYGLIPEFVGRIPSVHLLHDLDIDQMKQILTEPKHSITKQFQALFELDGIELGFNINSIQAIVERAYEQDLGARGLRKILEDVLLEAQYNIEDYKKEGVSKIVVTEDTVRKSSPVWTLKG